MRYLFFILIALAIVNTKETKAQKCKFSFDKTDPMTDARVVRNTIKIKSYFQVSFYRSGDDMRIELNVNYAGERNFIIPVGTGIDFKLSDASIMTLKSAQKATPVSYVTGTQIMTAYGISFYCSKEEMEKIANGGFSVVRTKLGDETLTYELKSKDAEKAAEYATCILTL